MATSNSDPYTTYTKQSSATEVSEMGAWGETKQYPAVKMH